MTCMLVPDVRCQGARTQETACVTPITASWREAPKIGHVGGPGRCPEPQSLPAELIPGGAAATQSEKPGHGCKGAVHPPAPGGLLRAMIPPPAPPRVSGHHQSGTLGLCQGCKHRASQTKLRTRVTVSINAWMLGETEDGIIFPRRECLQGVSHHAGSGDPGSLQPVAPRPHLPVIRCLGHGLREDRRRQKQEK